jgi:hypothetical protein
MENSDGLERAAAQGRECFDKRESLERKIESFLNTCLEVTNRPISIACRGKRTLPEMFFL